MLFSVEQAFEGREEIRAPLKTPAWEATPKQKKFRFISLPFYIFQLEKSQPFHIPEV